MASVALIALFLQQAFLLQEAGFESLYRQALEQRERALGKGAAKTVESARDLALYLAGRGDYASAIRYVEPALQTADSVEAATVLHNWAVTLEDQDGALAERMYRRALGIRVQALPVADVDLATTRLNLAGLLAGKKEAGTLAALALAAFEKKPGLTDGRASTACGLLGVAMATRGDVAGAERMFRRALVLAEKAHGPAGGETANALENLADLLAQTGRESAARPLQERAERIRKGSR